MIEENPSSTGEIREGKRGDPQKLLVKSNQKKINSALKRLRDRRALYQTGGLEQDSITWGGM